MLAGKPGNQQWVNPVGSVQIEDTLASREQPGKKVVREPRCFTFSVENHQPLRW